MEVGVDDPFCFRCGLKHTALTGDGVGHGNFGGRTGRMRRYDEDGEGDEAGVWGGAGARIMKMTEHVAGAAAAEEDAEEAGAEASGALASTSANATDAGDNWSGTGFGNAAKGGKGRKKVNL